MASKAVTIFDIKRFAVHDGPGIRTTVFLKGCPLRCHWCHNPESHSMKPLTVNIEKELDGKRIHIPKTYGEQVTIEDLMGTITRDRHFYEESGGGVSFSGGEPLMQLDALEAMLKKCIRQELHTTVDTSGYTSRENIHRISKYTRLFLYDLKNMDSGLHKKHTGVGNEEILSNADHLLSIGARVIFRIPVVPGINTSDEETGRFLAFIGHRRESIPELHLLPYHRIAEYKYKRLGMEGILPATHEPEEAFMKSLKLKYEGAGIPVYIGG